MPSPSLVRFLPTLLALVLPGTCLAAPGEDALASLLGSYATRPRDYPSGKNVATPDLAVPFRWHGYHEGAVAPFADARMLPHTDLLNPLEGEGVSVAPGSLVKFRFVEEHHTQGKQALRLDCPGQAIQGRKAVAAIRSIAGGPSLSEYLRARGMLNTAACYGPHYRWIKLDAFNPGQAEVRVRVAGVPFVLPAGHCTIAVKTVDAVDRGYGGAFNSIAVEVTGPAEDVTLFLDHLRVEQEIPTILSRRGLMLQFAARAEQRDPPVLWPGFSAIETGTMYSPDRRFGWVLPASKRQVVGHSFRSYENGLLWGRCQYPDSPLRIDLPNGRYGLLCLAAPSHNYSWSKGGVIKANGQELVFFPPRPESEVRRLALGGEEVDFRPGLCVWEALVRPAYYPATQVVEATVSDGRLLLELASTFSWHGLILFPIEDREVALKELGRLNYLLAESWDVSHPWIKADPARNLRYIGLHEEMLQPETIPGKLKTLKLTETDWARGFVPFVRGLTEAVYHDTIPAPEEAGVKELAGQSAPGEQACLTLGLLPLREVRGLRVTVSDLVGEKGRWPSARVQVRVARYHQKTMQFGHHNHDYNYQEHYLVKRPRLDLHPAAVRRVYLDVSVPADASPGKYAGRVEILSAEGKELTSLPLVLEVTSVALLDPPVFRASSLDEPVLKSYGFNTFHSTHERALAESYRGYLANLGYHSIKVGGKQINWSNFQGSKELLTPLLEAGKAGKGPRIFLGGPIPGTHGNPKAAEITRQFHEGLRKEFPAIDLLGWTTPAYYFRAGKQGFQQPHEWTVLAGQAPDDPKILEQARQDGKEFWFIDVLRHSKEQAGRFTFGVWLWRSGARGRYTTLEAALQYGYGTARESYRWEPYFTLLDVTTCNVDRALKESLQEGEWNPCRDLILLREGIGDLKYLYSLEKQIARVEARKSASPALAAAKKFLADLRSDVSIDLADYYEARSGAYGENWYPRAGNPWTSARFEALRRDTARHIIALGMEESS